ncbi:MAG: SpaH/EbpB family LPXTG-anchored major pilin [Anaerobutyricum sp.]
MKYNAIAKKLSMTTLAAAMLAAPAVNVFAATDVTIDTNRVGSLTIHKYDITAATAKGFDMNKYKSNGKQNAQAEDELKNYKIEGVEFTYMRVGDISTESVGGKIEVMYGIPVELEKILGLTDTRGDHKHSSKEVFDAMKNILLNNTQSKNKLEDYVMTGYGHTAMPMTDENGVSTATNLPIGLYLIIETKVPANVNTTVDPFFVSLPMTDEEGAHWFYDVHVYPKNQTNIPDIDKRVRQHDDVGYGKPEFLDTATSSEGEVVDYIVTSHMPKITSKATFLTKYTFVDTIAKGLTYNHDLSIYFYDNEADAKANNTGAAVSHWDVDSEYFRSSYNAASEKASQCTVQMTELGLKQINGYSSDTQVETNYSGLWMVLSYSATVNADASPILGDFGNNNDVNLTWRRTNMDKDDRLEDKCRVFSYGLNILKTAETADGMDPFVPTDVRFSLKNATDGHYIVARQSKAGSGIYYVVDASKKTVGADGLDEEGARDAATAFTPADDGTLIINGLEANDYILTETHTSKGYNLLKDPIKISIHQTQDEFVPSKTTLYDIVEIENNPNKKCIETNGDRAHAEVDGSVTEMEADKFTADNKPVSGNATVSTNARVKLNIVNTPSTIVQLPATGGAGTIAFTVAGCTVAFAGVMVATRKNKKDDENK